MTDFLQRIGELGQKDLLPWIVVVFVIYMLWRMGDIEL